MTMFFRKKPPIPPTPIKKIVTDLREDKFDVAKLRANLEPEIHVKAIEKPFYRVTCGDSKTMFEIYPALGFCNKKTVVERIIFESEAELALIINSEFKLK